MSQDLTKKKFRPGSLSRPRTARTVLLRMAADEARAQRIRDTYEQRKAESPREYTWKRLADHVGISERAVQDWSKTGGVEYDNAKKAAEFWNVDFDWLWRGPQEDRDTPDPFANGSSVDQVEEIREEFRGLVAGLDKKLDRITSEHETILRLLADQDAILKDLKAAARELPEEALRRWEERIKQALQGDSQPPPTKQSEDAATSPATLSQPAAEEQ